MGQGSSPSAGFVLTDEHTAAEKGEENEDAEEGEVMSDKMTETEFYSEKIIRLRTAMRQITSASQILDSVGEFERTNGDPMYAGVYERLRTETLVQNESIKFEADAIQALLDMSEGGRK